MWLGGDDLVSKMTFVWADGSELILGDALWFLEQPNGGDGEDCLWFADDLVHDHMCHYSFYVVCQKEF